MSRVMGAGRWRSTGRFPWATTMLMVLVVVLVRCCEAATNAGDVEVMQALSKNLDGENVMGWNGDDPCKWKNVACSNDRIVGIQLENVGVKGNLPSSFNQLSALATLGLQHNQLSGSLPSFKGMSALQSAYLNDNNFTSIPLDFFFGLTSLQALALDDNPLEPWIIPDDLKEAVMLVNFSASSAGLRGLIPGFFGDSLVSLQRLELAFNNLTGTIPSTFAGSNLNVLWLNNQVGDKLSGSIEVVAGMTVISQLWLQSNAFTGPIPDMSKCKVLKEVRLRDNMLTGLVPASITMLPMLQNISLLNNALQGPYPSFPNTIDAEIGLSSANSFCLPAPGKCDPRVNILLDFAEDIGYPYILASKWKGNDPCNDWLYVTCDPARSIAVLNLAGLGLSGTISPALGKLKNLTTLILSNNNLTGSIPKELAGLSHLQKLDVSNNKLSGKVPVFRSGVNVDVDGNTQIGKDAVPVTPGKAPPGSSNNQGNGTANAPANGGSDSGGIVAKKGSSSSSSSSVGIVVGSAVGGLVGLGLIIGVLGICLRKKTKKSGRVRSPNTVALHPQSSDPDTLKFTSMNSLTSEVSHSQSGPSSGHSDVHMVEAGNMIISIQVLRNVTDNFSEENVLGRGGFGVVYKGELHDGTKIAVKRMEAGVMSSKGLNEFQAEIAVLTKVRHRHLVALLGYCIEGTERLLVYEYMPQGPLSRHLFEWEKQNIRPLDWTKRLIIALDVARGVEYLHSLAQKSFIHRDLKPSNILLGDDMRAKVSDFGLVRLAPEGKCSVETRLAGTFGYLAPEYAVTGRVTTKADVFSFGVILMELITGRRALDESQPEESMHLVTWFRRMHINKETFRNAIDRVLEVTEETLKSICIVAELAGHCTAREPYQRPDMGHAVNVLSPLVEQWKPTDPDNEDYYGIDLDMTLPQALKKWQAFEDNSNVDDSVTSIDNSYSSIPTRPTGFADTFTSADGR